MEFGFKRAWVSWALAAALLPVTALADHDEAERFDDGDEVWLSVHVHDEDCGHAGPFPGVPSNPGRYELRTVDRWVPGRYEQAWVPRACFRVHHKRRCSGGYYERRWVPGRTEQVQDWVWVPAPAPAVRVSFSGRF